MLKDDIYELYLKQLDDKGEVNEHPAGRFMVRGGKLHHLEDNYGILSRILPEGDVDHYAHRIHQGLKNNPYLKVVSQEDRNTGKHLEELPEADIPDPPEEKQPLSFDYARGFSEPKLFQIMGDQASLDGAPITREEAMHISKEVENGVSTLKYHRAQGLQKAEEEAEEEEAPEVNVYEDPHLPGVGNKYAYKEWIQIPRVGVWIAMDVNSARSLNENHGRTVGDLALKAIAKVICDSLETVRPTQLGQGDEPSQPVKVFRIDGDGFITVVDSMEDAALFARKLTTKLQEIPAIKGAHQLSLSIGFGMDAKSADLAMDVAKNQRYHEHTKDKKFEAGSEPCFAYSLVPGAEGAVSLDSPNPKKSPGMAEPVENVTGQEQSDQKPSK